MLKNAIFKPENIVPQELKKRAPNISEILLKLFIHSIIFDADICQQHDRLKRLTRPCVGRHIHDPSHSCYVKRLGEGQGRPGRAGQVRRACFAELWPPLDWPG